MWLFLKSGFWKLKTRCLNDILFRGVDIGLSGIRLEKLSGGSSSHREGGRDELGLPIRPDFFPGVRCSLGRFFRLVRGVGLGVARGMIMVFTIGRWPSLGGLVGQGLLSPTVGSPQCESHNYSQVRLGLQKAVSFMYFFPLFSSLDLPSEEPLLPLLQDQDSKSILEGEKA